TSKNSNKNATAEGENLNNIWEKFELKLNDWITTTLPTIVSEVIKSIAGEAVKKHIDEYVSSTELEKSLGESIDFDSQQLHDEIKSINTELKTGLMELKNEVNMLKNENDNLEQYTKRCNIRIYGIPEAPTESTDDIVISFLQKELGVTISEVDISRSHRVGKKSNIARPIIIRFTKHNTKVMILRKRHLLKRNGRSLYRIQEDLTQTRRQLLKYLHDNCNDKVEKVWTIDGIIHFRPKTNTSVILKSTTLSSCINQLDKY
ncbi:Hypothetical predicted protein, partial [Paramuricea clavata]